MATSIIIGTSGDDTLASTPGVNDISGGADNDSIDGTQGVNTIHFNLGDGIDTVAFTPPRTYQYADFLQAAQQGLAQLATFSGDQYTNDYFASADASLFGNLPPEIGSVLSQMQGANGTPGAVSPTAATDA